MSRLRLRPLTRCRRRPASRTAPPRSTLPVCRAVLSVPDATPERRACRRCPAGPRHRRARSARGRSRARPAGPRWPRRLVRRADDEQAAQARRHQQRRPGQHAPARRTRGERPASRLAASTAPSGGERQPGGSARVVPGRLEVQAEHEDQPVEGDVDDQPDGRGAANVRDRNSPSGSIGWRPPPLDEHEAASATAASRTRPARAASAKPRCAALDHGRGQRDQRDDAGSWPGRSMPAVTRAGGLGGVPQGEQRCPASPIGALMKKIARQPSDAVSTPPTSGPADSATLAPAAHRPTARARARRRDRRG